MPAIPFAVNSPSRTGWPDSEAARFLPALDFDFAFVFVFAGRPLDFAGTAGIVGSYAARSAEVWQSSSSFATPRRTRLFAVPSGTAVCRAISEADMSP